MYETPCSTSTMVFSSVWRMPSSSASVNDKNGGFWGRLSGMRGGGGAMLFGNKGWGWDAPVNRSTSQQQRIHRVYNREQPPVVFFLLLLFSVPLFFLFRVVEKTGHVCMVSYRQNRFKLEHVCTGQNTLRTLTRRTHTYTRTRTHVITLFCCCFCHSGSHARSRCRTSRILCIHNIFICVYLYIQYGHMYLQRTMV